MSKEKPIGLLSKCACPYLSRSKKRLTALANPKAFPEKRCKPPQQRSCSHAALSCSAHSAYQQSFYNPYRTVTPCPTIQQNSRPTRKGICLHGKSGSSYSSYLQYLYSVYFAIARAYYKRIAVDRRAAFHIALYFDLVVNIAGLRVIHAQFTRRVTHDQHRVAITVIHQHRR